ncbi:MAG: hypothetical protein ACXV3T_07605 [Halobacteriota archaeon]
MKKASEYVVAYAHTKALVFEAKSTLDSIAAALNSLLELGVVESHVFFNEEFIAKFSRQTRFPSIKERYPYIVPQSLYDILVASDHYFPQLRTYLSTMFIFVKAGDGTFLLSDSPNTHSFEPGIEALYYCKKLLESVKYVFYSFNELVEDIQRIGMNEI